MRWIVFVEIHSLARCLVDDSHAALDGADCKNAVAVSRAERDIFVQKTVGVGLELAA